MVKRNILSILGLLAAGLALAELYLRHHLFAQQPVLVAIQVAAAMLFVWARLTFGLRSFHAAASTSRGPLVTHGPYRYWRHPIYASIIYFTWAGQPDSPAAIPIGLALIVTFGLIMRMLIEERFLVEAYPAYTDYAKRAKRLIPFVY